MGPTSESSFPMDRAAGPGSPMGTAPFCARGALLADIAREPPSNGGEKPDFNTLPGVTTGGALKHEGLRSLLPVIPPFPSTRDVIDPPSLPVVEQGDYGGGGRGEDVSPRLLLRERGR